MQLRGDFLLYSVNLTCHKYERRTYLCSLYHKQINRISFFTAVFYCVFMLQAGEYLPFRGRVDGPELWRQSRNANGPPSLLYIKSPSVGPSFASQTKLPAGIAQLHLAWPCPLTIPIQSDTLRPTILRHQTANLGGAGGLRGRNLCRCAVCAASGDTPLDHEYSN